MKEQNLLELNSSVRLVKGVGEKTEVLLNKLDIYTVNDLLQHYPRSYDIYEEPLSVKSILDSHEDEKVVAVQATLEYLYPIKQVRNLKILQCRVNDESGLM